MNRDDRCEPIEGELRKTLDALSLIGDVPVVGDNDWQQTIGMFEGDDCMKSISEATLRVRDSHRLTFDQGKRLVEEAKSARSFLPQLIRAAENYKKMMSEKRGK